MRTLPAAPSFVEERESRRESNRVVFAGASFILFSLTVLALLGFSQGANWDRVREIMEVVIPIEAGLLGAAAAYFFKSDD